MQSLRMQEPRKTLSKKGTGTCNQWAPIIRNPESQCRDLLKHTFYLNVPFPLLRTGSEAVLAVQDHPGAMHFPLETVPSVWVHPLPPFPSVAYSLCIVKYQCILTLQDSLTLDFLWPYMLSLQCLLSTSLDPGGGRSGGRLM